jgi:hypothetical protein
MKKFTYYLCWFLLLIILVGCKQTSKRDIEKKMTDTELVQKVVGEWKDDTYDYGNYMIKYNDKTIDFNSTILVIDSTEKNRINTHERDDEKFHYDFVIEKDQIIVYRSYEIKQTSKEPIVGGDLAPITLMKEVKISRTNILGSWQPLKNDYLLSIQVEASFIGGSAYNVILTKSDGTSKTETLTLLSEKENSIFYFINEQSTMKYRFSNYDNNALTITSIKLENDTDVSEETWVLKRHNG